MANTAEETEEEFDGYRYTPPPKKTKEMIVAECHKKIQGYKDKMLTTRNIIRKHKRLINYHTANIAVFENHMKLLEEELKDIEQS